MSLEQLVGFTVRCNVLVPLFFLLSFPFLSCRHCPAPAVSGEPEGLAMQMGCGNTSCLASACTLHANLVMHEAMAIEFSCEEVEADFLRMMIPHHQGAIDMCNGLLAHPNVDSALRDLCLGLPNASGVASNFELLNLQLLLVAFDLYLQACPTRARSRRTT